MKKNYYVISMQQIAAIKALNKPVRLLLHVCCAPCACFPLEFLEEHFDITLYYNNSNIYPLAEYEMRLNELKQYIAKINENRLLQVKLVIPSYDNSTYNQFLKLHRSSTNEGCEGCFKCYEKRMMEGFKYAQDNAFSYYTTVMSISRQKNSVVLNEMGERMGKQFDKVQFLYADFKKKGGQQRRDILSKDMYRQQYCGCIYSYQEYQGRLKQKADIEKS